MEIEEWPVIPLGITTHTPVIPLSYMRDRVVEAAGTADSPTEDHMVEPRERTSRCMRLMEEPWGAATEDSRDLGGTTATVLVGSSATTRDPMIGTESLRSHLLCLLQQATARQP